MKKTKINSDQLKRSILFTPCRTKEDLHRWVKVFLEIDLPDGNVCEESTSNPMDLLWEMYSKALEGTDPDFTQFLGYSARGAGKTLIASIMELLCLFHLRRECIHFASIESQAKISTDYIEKYLKTNVLKDFIVSKNKRTITVAWYENYEKTRFFSPAEYNQLGSSSKSVLHEKRFSVKIVVATMNAVNGLHGAFLTNDECDLTPKRILDESKGIPNPGTERGELPITFYTSTRKFSFGNVQEIIDNASETGVIIRWWNILDVTRACPPERHLPQEPKIPIYYSEKYLTAISEKEYNNLTSEKQADYLQKEGYSGCLKNCKLFAACKGRLATKQQSNSKLLKPIDYVQGIFKTTPLDIVKAQFLCWKPSMEGMVYPRLDRELHAITPNEIAKILTGQDYNYTLTKEDLINIMKGTHGYFAAGLDWGFTHCFAGCVAFIDGNRAFIIEAWEIPELELPQKLELAEKTLRPYGCSAVWADPAYPADIKTFKRAGYKMKDWFKNAGSVVAGIEVVRMKLMPTFDMEPQLYFLRDDPGCELLVKRLSSYHWKVDSDERPTNIPDDKDDDGPDALRYLIMNTFSPKGKLSTSFDRPQSKFVTGDPQYTAQDWMKQIIQERVGEIQDEQDNKDSGDPTQKKKGILFKI